MKFFLQHVLSETNDKSFASIFFFANPNNERTNSFERRRKKKVFFEQNVVVGGGHFIPSQVCVDMKEKKKEKAFQTIPTGDEIKAKRKLFNCQEEKGTIKRKYLDIISKQISGNSELLELRLLETGFLSRFQLNP